MGDRSSISSPRHKIPRDLQKEAIANKSYQNRAEGRRKQKWNEETKSWDKQD